jgi:hypothetical protein
MTGARALTLKSYTARFALPLWRWYLFGSVMLAAVNLINLEVPQLAKRIVNGPCPSRARWRPTARRRCSSSRSDFSSS